MQAIAIELGIEDAFNAYKEGKITRLQFRCTVLGCATIRNPKVSKLLVLIDRYTFTKIT